MIYWVLSFLTAILAYFCGCLNSVVLASNFVFHKNLRRLGSGNAFVSNFWRVYGWQGLLKLAAVELALDLLPLLIGAGLFRIKGQAPVGCALAGFCLLMGRMYPATYALRGGHGLVVLLLTALCVDVSLGVAVLIVAVAALLLSRYVAVGAIAGALTMIVVALLMLDNAMASRLCVFLALALMLRHIPSVSRLLNGREPRISFEKDINYKFDERF